VHDGLMDGFGASPAVRAQLDAIEARVAAGTLAPADGARRLLDAQGAPDSGGQP
jgi:hypothetical protein